MGHRLTWPTAAARNAEGRKKGVAFGPSGSRRGRVLGTFSLKSVPALKNSQALLCEVGVAIVNAYILPELDARIAARLVATISRLELHPRSLCLDEARFPLRGQATKHSSISLIQLSVDGSPLQGGAPCNFDVSDGLFAATDKAVVAVHVRRGPCGTSTRISNFQGKRHPRQQKNEKSCSNHHHPASPKHKVVAAEGSSVTSQ